MLSPFSDVASLWSPSSSFYGPLVLLWYLWWFCGESHFVLCQRLIFFLCFADNCLVLFCLIGLLVIRFIPEFGVFFFVQYFFWSPGCIFWFGSEVCLGAMFEATRSNCIVCVCECVYMLETYKLCITTGHTHYGRAKITGSITKTSTLVGHFTHVNRQANNTKSTRYRYTKSASDDNTYAATKRQ